MHTILVHLLFSMFVACCWRILPTPTPPQRELLRQNEALRAKEAEQLKCLDFYEAWVKTLGSDAAAAADASAPADSTDSSQLPVTARLDKRVQKLKQILRPQHAPSSRPIPMQDRPMHGSSSSQPASSAFSAGGAQGGAVTGGPSSSGAGSPEGAAAGPSTDEKMANWFAAVTPQDLNYFRTMTAEEFAGERGQQLRGSWPAGSGQQ